MNFENAILDPPPGVGAVAKSEGGRVFFRIAPGDRTHLDVSVEPASMERIERAARGARPADAVGRAGRAVEDHDPPAAGLGFVAGGCIQR